MKDYANLAQVISTLDDISWQLSVITPDQKVIFDRCAEIVTNVDSVIDVLRAAETELDELRAKVEELEADAT